MAQERPNILLIMSDEHDPAVTGCYGDRVVHTPELDRLAAGGVVFDGCYTTSPLCVPARLSFTAGQYISKCGAWSNSCWLPSADYPSLPRILNEAGYDSVLCGKMHYDKTRRYGFRDLIAKDENGFLKTGRGGRRDPASTAMGHKSWEQRTSQFFVGNEDKSRVMQLDRRRTDVACDFLARRGPHDQPFFMLLGYIAPHFPLIAPDAYFRRHEDRVPMPDLPAGWFERLPTNYRQLIYGFGVNRDDRNIVKLGRELYWALVSWMDTEIGQVLATLRGSAAADDTIVIYTSDHGENKGDHGMWWKNNMFEHASRIPLIVNWPERWAGGQRRAGACSLVDLTRTVAELAGARVPENWDGHSMLAWLDDRSAPWKDRAVSEYYAHNISSGFAMLREGPWKYVYHTRMNQEYGPEQELYHVERDPGEWANLAADPAQRERVTGMHRALATELGRDPEEAEQECRHDYATGYAR
ncbi:MAG: sulfatase-like hydrolase/transferase [Kiritimatiellae bacterium]|nr:sulfatase-like hydrolase/transferase [Kiritimatiellia bacterium]